MVRLLPILYCSLQRSYSGILKEIILFTMILNISNRKVVYSKLSGVFTFTDNDWNLGNYYTCLYNVITCDTSNIVFMDNYSKIDNSLVSKTFYLDPHYQVSFTFKFWRIDVWSSKLFEVYADQQIKYSRSFSDSDTPTNICQDATKSDESIEITITLLHNDPALWVVLKGQGQRWGISDFELSIDECAPGCDSCSSSQCFNQKSVPITLPWTTLETFPTKLGCFAYKFEWTYGTYMEMEIDLDTHIKISAKIRFLLLNYNTPTLDIKLDDQLVTSSQQISPRIIWTRSFCNHVQILQVAINDFVHTNPKIKIRADIILTQYDAAEGPPILGIPDFQLFITVSEKQVDTDSQGLPYEGCQLDISQFIEGCAFCVRNVCLHCQEGWNYVELEQKCSPICGDAKLVQNEQCDDGNIIPYDGCYKCQYSCPQYCKNCVKGKCIECQQPQILVNGQCLIQCNQVDQYSIQQYTGCFSQIDNVQLNGYYQHTMFNQDNLKFFLHQFLDCDPQHYGIFGFNYNQCNVNDIQLCEDQAWNICHQCKDGYQLTKSQQQCVPVCNDGQIVDFEVCDDANGIQFDGCYKCQQNCQLECSNCVNSQCLRCIEGWDLIEGQCLPNCGDGITVQTEQCDDGNQESGDGCYKCQAECPYCEICNYYNKCQLCQEHFRSVNMLCLPYCGDNYTEPGLEECDDGNQIQYDGCYNCQLECDTQCRKCISGQCKDICKFDEQEIDGKCFKFNLEDQSINNFYDCPDGCSKCVQGGECLNCQQNYVLYGGLCYQIECGNGIQELLEECDDGNITNNDGCSNDCKIESNWNCFTKNTQTNQCFSITQVSLDYVNQTKYYQYVQLNFSKKVVLGNDSDINNFPAKDSFQILGLQPDEYIINCNPKVPISQDESRNVQYEFQIYFNYQIKRKLIFNIQLNETILDENGIVLSPTNVSVELKVPKILTRPQLTASKTLKNVGHGMMIGLCCSGFLMLALGKFSEVIQLMDILQQQQFLKYLNFDYPQNVNVYFESSNFITLQPLLNYINFPDFYENIFSQEFQQSVGKFQEYQINADFLTNIESFIFQISVGCICCSLLYLYEKFISKHISITKIFNFIKQSKSKYLESIWVYLYKYKKKHLEIKQIFSQEVLMNFIYINSQDLMFKVGLFLISNTKSEIRERVSLLICFFYLGNILFIFLYNYGKSKVQNQLTQVVQLKHEKLILFKQFSFHFILTQIQFYPILQSLLISMVNTTYIALILGFKLKIQRIELLTILSYELPITIFTLLNLSYSDNLKDYFSLNQQIYVGFAQIGLLVSSLIGPLIQIIVECQSQYKKFKQKNTEKEEARSKTSTNIFIQAF